MLSCCPPRQTLCPRCRIQLRWQRSSFCHPRKSLLHSAQFPRLGNLPRSAPFRRRRARKPQSSPTIALPRRPTRSRFPPRPPCPPRPPPPTPPALADNSPPFSPNTFALPPAPPLADTSAAPDTSAVPAPAGTVCPPASKTSPRSFVVIPVASAAPGPESSRGKVRGEKGRTCEPDTPAAGETSKLSKSPS